MSAEVLTIVYLGNAFGVVLLVVLLLSNMGQNLRDTDSNNILRLLIISAIICVVDPIVYTLDGKEGVVIKCLIYLLNSILYLSNMIIGMCWLRFLSSHIGVHISKVRRIIHRSLFIFGSFCLILNIFVPIVFTVDSNNVYQRTYLYWLYVTIAFFYIIDSIVIYCQARKKGGVLNFFPIHIFLIPVGIGIVVQSLFYGVSVIGAAITIAIAGIMTAMKNELLYTDSLTGIYNRFYLSQLQKEITRSKKNYITGIMADLNEFKKINDKFGHSAGDEALITAAHLFEEIVADYGVVTRYAGDEFVIFLNTIDENEVENMIDSIDKGFEEYNNKKLKPYKLSASMGYCVFDFKNQTVNEFMNIIDSQMYENKSQYYQKHDRRKKQ